MLKEVNIKLSNIHQEGQASDLQQQQQLNNTLLRLTLEGTYQKAQPTKNKNNLDNKNLGTRILIGINYHKSINMGDRNRQKNLLVLQMSQHGALPVTELPGKL